MLVHACPGVSTRTPPVLRVLVRASHCLGTPCTWQLYDTCDLIFRETARVLFFLRKNRRQCSRRTGGSNAYRAVCHPVSSGEMHTMLLSVHACGAQADTGAGPACSPLGHQWARAPIGRRAIVRAQHGPRVCSAGMSRGAGAAACAARPGLFARCPSACRTPHGRNTAQSHAGNFLTRLLFP